MSLPNPNPTAAAHSAQLTDLIRKTISANGGSISFAQFMELALYAPGLGYYMAGNHKLGQGGDFVTAPEISAFFGSALAQQIQQVLSVLNGGDILELGAGSGVLAKDILQALAAVNSLPRHYYILEVSPELQQRQAQLLQTECPELARRVVWLNTWPAQPITGVILANEVMDALPVHAFYHHQGLLYERRVRWQDNHFTWQLTELPREAPFTEVWRVLDEYALPDDYTLEMNLYLPNWIADLGKSLTRGVALLLDYGYGRSAYYHPDRSMGTLLCYYQQQRHADPFFNVGLQDITAHIDFTQVAESAVAAGMTVAGFTTQADFLLACGLLEKAERLASSATFADVQQLQALKKLIMPSEMGELIKVLALAKDWPTPLLGFPQPDRRREL